MQDQISGNPHVSEEAEGERLKQALSEAEASRQRIADLEEQLNINQETMERMKADAKKYVETLKKKEQVSRDHTMSARRVACVRPLCELN